MDGLIFGLLDNGVLILGAFTGLSVERYLPTRFQAGVGGVFGAGIGNTVSDGIGAVVDPVLQGMVGGDCSWLYNSSFYYSYNSQI